MRARSIYAPQWEIANSSPYLYAGAGKGAEVAVWKQSARAELAHTSDMVYVQALIDLVKVFERIANWLLVKEGDEA